MASLRKTTVIDDVDVKGKYWNTKSGSPILFENPEIRRMLDLAKAGEKDVVFDFGCGWAQNLIIAAPEFNVKKCFGIECLKKRYEIANDRVKEWSLSDQITIIKGYFGDLIKGHFKEVKIEDATIILYLLGTEKEIIDQFFKKLREGCRLIYYYNALIPEIKPDAIDHPFYVSIYPFKRPSSELDWLKSVVQKEKSSYYYGKQLSKEELWQELTHDYKLVVRGKTWNIKHYQKRLRSLFK